MKENSQNQEKEEFLKDLPVQTEEISYQPDEMLACQKCSRTNPPTRVKCMYCGAALEISAEQAGKIKPSLRKLENWENGFNLIYLPKAEKISAENAAQIAKLTGLDKEYLKKLFDWRRPLPIVRCETAKEAEILRNRLNETGLETFEVSDESLAAENMPKRLRGLEFRDEKILLILFNNDEIAEIGAEDLVLMVTGAIFQKAIESTEARKKGESKILDATETASDELLIDIYTKQNANGYRILTKGFDFSCLGAEKSILARENIKKLAAKLQSLAPRAKLIDEYLKVRNVLGEIWEIEQRKDSRGLARQRFGKFDLSSISTSNNLQQFTKFSRLQRHLL